MLRLVWEVSSRYKLSTDYLDVGFNNIKHNVDSKIAESYSLGWKNI